MVTLFTWDYTTWIEDNHRLDQFLQKKLKITRNKVQALIKSNCVLVNNCNVKPAYKLQIDFGPLGVLNSSAQITKKYQIKDLKEKQIIALVNVGKRKIANFESQCLVLGANHNDEVILLAPEKKIPNGQQVL